MCRVRVTYDVRDRLDGDPERGDLDSRGQLGQLVGSLDADLHAAFVAVHTGRLLADRGHQPELIQRGRAQPVDELADIADRLLRRIAQRGQHRAASTTGNDGERRPRLPPVVGVWPV